MARNHRTVKTINLVCPYCRKDFCRAESYINKQQASQRYCSSDCARLYRWQPIRRQRAARQAARNEALVTRNAEKEIGFTSEELDTEIWRAIPNLEYSASSLGRVRRDKDGRGVALAGRILAFSANRSGYLEAKLYDGDGASKIFSAHSLVMVAFVGPRPKGMEINHRDGERHNNRLPNLEYVTPTANNRDAVERYQHQTRLRHWAKNGEHAPGAKYSAEIVREIRRRATTGISQSSISRSMEIPIATVHQIVSRRSWRHI